MSKSQPVTTNPCNKWIEFSGDSGTFSYYDKEKDKKFALEMPVYFAVCDELATITGFNKKHECGVYSNEVRSTKNEILRVKTFKGGESVTGLYADIRDNIVALGGKFTKSIYALLIHEDLSYEFVNFKFRGAAFSSWMEKKFNPEKFIVGVTETVEEMNGKTKYQVPVFKPFKMSPEIDAAAIEQDKILQEYLKEYFSRVPESDIAKAEAVTEHESPQLKDEPFETPWRGSKPTKEQVVEKAKENLMSRGGKREVKSMSNADDLPQMDNADDLPF
jgi:hypothetical protein